MSGMPQALTRPGRCRRRSPTRAHHGEVARAGPAGRRRFCPESLPSSKGWTLTWRPQMRRREIAVDVMRGPGLGGLLEPDWVRPGATPLMLAMFPTVMVLAVTPGAVAPPLSAGRHLAGPLAPQGAARWRRRPGRPRRPWRTVRWRRRCGRGCRGSRSCRRRWSLRRRRGRGRPSCGGRWSTWSWWRTTSSTWLPWSTSWWSWCSVLVLVLVLPQPLESTPRACSAPAARAGAPIPRSSHWLPGPGRPACRPGSRPARRGGEGNDGERQYRRRSWTAAAAGANAHRTRSRSPSSVRRFSSSDLRTRSSRSTERTMAKALRRSSSS